MIICARMAAGQHPARRLLNVMERARGKGLSCSNRREFENDEIARREHRTGHGNVRTCLLAGLDGAEEIGRLFLWWEACLVGRHEAAGSASCKMDTRRPSTILPAGVCPDRVFGS
jgi:hypothetical protein